MMDGNGIRVRDRRNQNQYTVHNRIMDEWYPIISASGLALYNLYCRMASKGDEHCYPGIRLLAAHMQMGTSTISEYNKLLVWCELVYIRPGIGRFGQTNDYYLLEVPAVNSLLERIRNAVCVDGESAFHKTVLKRLDAWRPIQSHWRKTEGATRPDGGQMSFEKSYPQLWKSDPAIEHPDPAIEHPDPRSGSEQSTNNNPQTTIHKQQSTTTTDDVVVAVLEWMGFVGSPSDADKIPALDVLLGWAYYVRIDRPGHSPVAVARAGWRRAAMPPLHWVELARFWLGLCNDDRVRMLEVGRRVARRGGMHGLDDVLDEMLVAVEDEVIDCFCQAYTALNGVVAPSVLMPVEED